MSESSTDDQRRDAPAGTAAPAASDASAPAIAAAGGLGPSGARSGGERPHGEDFRALVENASDIIARYDRELRHVYVNPAVEEFTGHPPEHFLGKTSRQVGLLEGTPADAWEASLRAAFEEGTEQRREFRVEGPDGVIWTDTRFVPEPAPDGTVRSVLEISRDITARKVAEAGLRRTTQHLRALLDASPQGVVSFDREGRVTTWNPAAERIFGWTAEEMVGSPLPPVPDGSWRRMTEMARRALKGQTVTDVKLELHSRTLERRVVSVSAAPLRSAAGSRITGILAVLDDVTEGKRVEEERRRLAAILEASPDFVGTSDVRGDALWVNEAGKRLVGMDPDESAEGMPIASFHPPAVAVEIMDRLLPALQEAGVARGETALQHRDGSEIPVSMAAIAHRDDRDRVAFHSIVARDLRPRKALEARLRQSERLEAVGRLAGGVAHEYNNALTVVHGHLDLILLHDELPGDLREDVERIRESARRMAELTAELTAFGRRQHSRLRVVDVGELVRRARPALATVAGEAVELDVGVEGTDHLAEVDPAQIEQALVAMTLNAREAMPLGGRLEVGVGWDEVAEDDAEAWDEAVPPGRYVSLRVSDTGEGMDPRTRKRVFEPFFTTRDPSEHSGLGLSRVYGMVKQHGGCVTVESQSGEGSAFTLLLPAAEATAEPATATPDPES